MEATKDKQTGHDESVLNPVYKNESDLSRKEKRLLEKEKLKDYYREFCQYEEACRFQGCVHINEPDCRVKEALEAGKISRIRYENYKLLFEELKNMRRY